MHVAGRVDSGCLETVHDLTRPPGMLVAAAAAAAATTAGPGLDASPILSPRCAYATPRARADEGRCTRRQRHIQRPESHTAMPTRSLPEPPRRKSGEPGPRRAGSWANDASRPLLTAGCCRPRCVPCLRRLAQAVACQSSVEAWWARRARQAERLQRGDEKRLPAQRRHRRHSGGCTVPRPCHRYRSNRIATQANTLTHALQHITRPDCCFCFRLWREPQTSKHRTTFWTECKEQSNLHKVREHVTNKRLCAMQRTKACQRKAYKATVKRCTRSVGHTELQ